MWVCLHVVGGVASVWLSSLAYVEGTCTLMGSPLFFLCVCVGLDGVMCLLFMHDGVLKSWGPIST